MRNQLRRFVGQTVEMIYLDSHHNLSQRKIHVLSAEDGVLMAYCYTRKAPRLFCEENVLAIMPVKSRAV